MHYQRAWREKHPITAAFAALRDHALERGIKFTITIEQFKCFAQISDYIARKGNLPTSLTVDRIDNLKGYEPGNIQALSKSENSIKRSKQDAMRHKKGFAWAHRKARGKRKR